MIDMIGIPALERKAHLKKFPHKGEGLPYNSGNTDNDSGCNI